MPATDTPPAIVRRHRPTGLYLVVRGDVVTSHHTAAAAYSHADRLNNPATSTAAVLSVFA